MNPPLGNETDRATLIKELLDGTIDAIATDHAPHTAEEKNRPVSEAPFGVTGLETSFCVSYTALVKSGLTTLSRLIEMMAARPARILGLDRGELRVGAAADLTVTGMSLIFRFRPRERSKQLVTPLCSN